MITSEAFKVRKPKDWAGALKAPSQDGWIPEPARSFYHDVVTILLQKNLPFLLGGAYAFHHYTGVARHTKDLDLFVKPSDCERILDALSSEGYPTEVTFRHWLAKVHSPTKDLIDVIYSSGNGIAEVDDLWFRHAEMGTFLDLPVKVVPIEEMIWSKGFILERDRYDGADVAHLLRAQAPRIDWQRLLGRFGQNWRVLLSHLTLFGFVYPCDVDRIPKAVMEELLSRLQRETQSPAATREKLCRGTLLSHGQYKKDLSEWGYIDARLPPHGNMTPEDIRQWTAAFEK